jgi:hypothetical protein
MDLVRPDIIHEACDHSRKLVFHELGGGVFQISQPLTLVEAKLRPCLFQTRASRPSRYRPSPPTARCACGPRRARPLAHRLRAARASRV